MDLGVHFEDIKDWGLFWTMMSNLDISQVNFRPDWGQYWTSIYNLDLNQVNFGSQCPNWIEVLKSHQKSMCIQLFRWHIRWARKCNKKIYRKQCQLLHIILYSQKDASSVVNSRSKIVREKETTRKTQKRAKVKEK